MSAPPRLVFATRRPPYPVDNGARIRANRLIHALAREFDVVLVTPRHAAGSGDHDVSPDDVAAALPDSVRIAWTEGLTASRRVGQAASILRRRSYEFGRYATTAVTDVLRAELAGAEPAVLHLDDPGVALAARGLDAGLVAFAPHNVEHRIIAAAAASAPSVARRALLGLESRKVALEERRLWRESDLCVAVSPLDADVMRAGGAHDVVVAPNGTDPVQAKPLMRRSAPGPVQLLFVGSCYYGPNERGLSWFVREALPAVRERVTVAFDVVGRPPQRPVAAPEVRYVGSVPSVEPHYERAHAVVVPLFEGSGTRLKVVEAMAHGRPVISTALGAEGLPVRANEHFLRAETPREFAEAVVRVDRWMEGSDELDGLLARAGGVARALLWPEIGAALAAEYKERLC
jgi:polysaccharide biosynthesis protein PslH